ncbi:MAG: argininosuccinate lyase, partial [Myxococcales bacterium]|nr:argininosuccinate lyase [Myxococcales bacterium]
TRTALGFATMTANSLDGVSDRDFVLDFVYAASVLMTHLGRMGEELVLWSTHEFAFVRLGDAVTTGSSMMPNKKNPDGAELLRGKAGRVFGDLMGLFATLKGLPLTYNKDMQEDKEPLFDAFDTVSLALDMAAAMFSDAAFDTNRMRAACSGWVNATDLCEALVRAGEPLRTAHHQTGRLVALAVQRGVELEQLPLDDVHEVAPLATVAMLDDLSLDAILDSKALVGGTAPAQVRAAAQAARARLEE